MRFLQFFLTFVAVLTLFDWWSIVIIRQKVLVSEYFEDMFNNILEARRYEKKFSFITTEKVLMKLSYISAKSLIFLIK